MKKSLLNYLVCPYCESSFSLKIFKESGREIEEGELICRCGRFFSILNFIPRILADNLSLEKKKTAESFGFEWEKFSSMRAEWQKNFNFYFEPTDKSSLKDKMVLEIGCGNGRHTYYAGKLAKELFAVDLGSAVDVAFANNRENKNIHFIQADIYNLPFRKGFFDFVFCIGVLHHLPTPEEGFKKLLSLAKNKAGILIYVYHSFAKTSFNFYLLSVVNFFRNFAKNIPHKILYILCYPVAFVSFLILVLPYKFVFKKVGIRNWPLGNYANYSFFVMLNDTFDRFSAPIENRYTKEQILDWYRRANLKNIKILGGSGWRVFGIKN